MSDVSKCLKCISNYGRLIVVSDVLCVNSIPINTSQTTQQISLCGNSCDTNAPGQAPNLHIYIIIPTPVGEKTIITLLSRFNSTNITNAWH